MTSVVIAAHNEAAVIGRCLDTISGAIAPDDLDVTVVANGCTDGTVSRARRYPWVRVVELADPGKSRALNAGDQVAVGFPRIYLDADMVLTAAELRRLVARLQAGSGSDSDSSSGSGSVQVAVPGRRLELTGRPLLIRAYYAIQTRLPAFDEGLFGRGVIALSEVGRARFDEFPEVIADDLFLDSLFSSSERTRVDDVVSVVATPLHTRDLVARLTRVRRGNTDLRAAGPRVRRSDPMSWFRDVVLPHPWLAPAAVCYVAITLYAALAARRAAGQQGWLRDESSRQETPASGGGKG